MLPPPPTLPATRKALRERWQLSRRGLVRLLKTVAIAHRRHCFSVDEVNRLADALLKKIAG